MKCPSCGAWSEVLATRQAGDLNSRRRICANGHRFSTYEVSKEALVEAGFRLPGRRESIDAAAAARTARNEAIYADPRLLRQIALDYGVGVSTVSDIKIKLRMRKRTAGEK